MRTLRGEPPPRRPWSCEGGRGRIAVVVVIPTGEAGPEEVVEPAVRNEGGGLETRSRRVTRECCNDAVDTQVVRGESVDMQALVSVF